MHERTHAHGRMRNTTDKRARTRSDTKHANFHYYSPAEGAADCFMQRHQRVGVVVLTQDGRQIAVTTVDTFVVVVKTPRRRRRAVAVDVELVQTHGA